MIVTNCATGTIAPYVPSATMPWTRRRIAHLARRMGFGLNPQRIDEILDSNLSPTQLVDLIIDNAINKPLPPEPEWSNWSLSNYGSDTIQSEVIQQIYEWIFDWMEEMVSENNFREKLEMFWHNHFVTRLDDYNCPSYMYQYHTIIQKNVLGNFKTLTTEIGTTPAMLIYLNGVQNTRTNPNENYARELYELFTLGVDNGYTQTDITETARALTGWNGFTEGCAPIGYLPIAHDPGVKTIFGQTGNWNYDDVHTILFEQRANEIAQHICTKLYKRFVNPEIDQTIIDELAATFLANNFELAPVYRQLFKSEHFFDEANMDVQIKSPIEMMLNYVKEFEYPYESFFDTNLNYNQFFLRIYFEGATLGQELMNPVDVAGWQGNRNWVNSSTLIGRWETMQNLVFYIYENYKYLYIDFAKQISGNSNDPAFITQLIVDHFVPVGLQTPADYERATNIFKSDYVPANYFEDGTWTLDYNEDVVAAQVALLIIHISKIPEFQFV